MRGLQNGRWTIGKRCEACAHVLAREERRAAGDELGEDAADAPHVYRRAVDLGA